MNRERFIALPSRLGVPFQDPTHTGLPAEEGQLRSSRVFFLLASFFSYFSSFACSEGCFRREAKMSAKRAASGEVCAKNSLLPFVHPWNLKRLFSITSSSRMLWDYSGVFHAGGYAWKLALKYGELEAQEGKSYLTLFLVLVDASPPPSDIEVVLEASVVDENCSQRSKRKVIHGFRQRKSEECHPSLISLETLECRSSGFLIAEIIDVAIHAEKNASLSPKPKNNSLAYTWKIDGFSKLTKQSYDSGPFLYNDHIWYLKIFPKGDSEENKSISLYLYLDDASTLPHSVKISADYYVDWVDQISGKNHQHKGPGDFDSKSSGWGWSEFLSLDALHEPSRGLLVNDTCIIKVGFYKCDVSK